jgi:FkbM family methyltransferase
MSLNAVKQISISLGLYRPARALHRLIYPDHTRPDHIKLLSGFIKPGDLVFDVGAYAGYRTELMLALGAKVIAFEPQPAIAREARARGGPRRLTVIEAALGAQAGTADLYLHADNSGGASLNSDWYRTEDHGKITVPVTTLDAEIKKFGLPSFCKIDVEGFEVDVLRGLSSPIKSLSFEYQCDERGIGKVRQCLDLITKLATYEFNLTGTEDGQWLSSRWMSKEEFLSSFPNCAHPHFYGDIFTRVV